MHRYRSTWLVLPAAAALLAGCALPSSRDNAAAMTGLVATQTPASLAWRRDADADARARTAADALLTDGLTLDEAVSVAFLLNPDLQVYFEQLEISRSQYVAAATPPNPVAIVGVEWTNFPLPQLSHAPILRSITRDDGRYALPVIHQHIAMPKTGF